MLTRFQNFAFLPMIYFLFPETKGLTLEGIDFLFLKEDRLPAGERPDTTTEYESKRVPKDAKHVEQP